MRKSSEELLLNRHQHFLTRDQRKLLEDLEAEQQKSEKLSKLLNSIITLINDANSEGIKTDGSVNDIIERLKRRWIMGRLHDKIHQRTARIP